MIELHDENLKYNIDDKFNPKGYLCKNHNINAFSFIKLAVYCNNFEAYKLFINHKNFNKEINSDEDFDWFKFIIQKYESGKTLSGKQYLEELIKLDIIIESVLISFCNNINTVKTIFDKVELNKYNIRCVFASRRILNNIKVFFLEYLFMNKS